MSTTPTAIAAYQVHSWRDEQGAPTIVAGDSAYVQSDGVLVINLGILVTAVFAAGRWSHITAILPTTADQ